MGKRDREISSLKDRLHHLLLEDEKMSASNRDKVRKGISRPRDGMIEMSACLTANPRKTIAESEEKLDSTMKKNYEDRLRIISSENHTLRHSLKRLTETVSKTLAEQQGCDVKKVLEAGVFELPFELSEGLIEAHLEEKLEAFGEGNPSPHEEKEEVLPSPLRRLRAGQSKAKDTVAPSCVGELAPPGQRKAAPKSAGPPGLRAPFSFHRDVN